MPASKSPASLRRVRAIARPASTMPSSEGGQPFWSAFKKRLSWLEPCLYGSLLLLGLSPCVYGLWQLQHGAPSVWIVTEMPAPTLSSSRVLVPWEPEALRAAQAREEGYALLAYPTGEEAPPKRKASRKKRSRKKAKASKTAPQVVAINTATLAQLDALPGLGEKLAQRILTARARQGGFHCWQELDAVSGIGPKLLSQLRPWLTGLSDDHCVTADSKAATS